MAKFQSTPPARGATARTPAGSPRRLDFNPRPPRGGRRRVRHNDYGSRAISIHAPREGGDTGGNQVPLTYQIFQSTPPARGATPIAVTKKHFPEEFQSTPPARGATCWRRRGTFCGQSFQSTPPARGATINRLSLFVVASISIHAPREGGDDCRYYSVCIQRKEAFQSTPPARGATPHCKRQLGLVVISIHAPREGGDIENQQRHIDALIFQSTPPARGATENQQRHIDALIFQSTPPARGATAKMHSFTCGSLTNK